MVDVNQPVIAGLTVIGQEPTNRPTSIPWHLGHLLKVFFSQHGTRGVARVYVDLMVQPL